MNAWGTLPSREEPQSSAFMAAFENHNWGLCYPDLSDGPEAPVPPGALLTLPLTQLSSAVPASGL